MKKLIFIMVVIFSFLGCKDNNKTENSTEQSKLQENKEESQSMARNYLEIGCYVYKANGNHVKMEVIEIDGDSVTAKLSYSYSQKDKNEGILKGRLDGDKLFGTYRFNSEGKDSSRDIAFKIEKNQIVEGFGDLTKGGTKFKDPTKLTYSSTTPWKKANCNM